MVSLYFSNYHHYSHCIAEAHSYIYFIYLSLFFLKTGEDIGAQSLSSAAVKKDGLYLSISPVTTAHEGTYVCSVKQNNMELIRTYNITVVGEK